ncbi:arsenate reductase family protein [Halovulum sp. GXIMD14794]
MTLTLYGLPTCDSCRKARKALEAAGYGVVFRDVRADPLSQDEWAPLLAEFGDQLINRKSQTWRNLSDFLKVAEADALLEAQPTVMKRPVIVGDGRMTIGWDADVQTAWSV